MGSNTGVAEKPYRGEGLKVLGAQRPHGTDWKSNRKNSRENHNDEVEPIPGVSQVCEISQDETSCQHFHASFDSVNTSKGFPVGIN